MVFKAIGRENVPKDLFPNQSDRAKKIINDASITAASIRHCLEGNIFGNAGLFINNLM